MRYVIVALLAVVLSAPVSVAQVPTTMSYQGRLLQNPSQDPVAGPVDITFSIWSDFASTDPQHRLWFEPWTAIPLQNGIFSVFLGSNGSPLDPADFQGDFSFYLQLEIDGEILAPRQQLGAVPFAIVDEPANELQAVSLSENTLSISGSDSSVDLSLLPAIAALEARLATVEERMPPRKLSSVSPSGTISNPAPSYVWDALEEATGYELWVDDLTSAVSQVVSQSFGVDDCTATTCTVTPGTLLNLHDYRWKARASNLAGDGQWSDPVEFSVVPGAPTLVSPSGQVVDLTPTFIWAPVPGATTYDLWVDDLSTGTQQVIRQTVAGTTYTDATPLTYGHTYGWLLRASGPSGYGPWSDATEFAIGSSSCAGTMDPIVIGQGSFATNGSLNRDTVFAESLDPLAATDSHYFEIRYSVSIAAGLSWSYRLYWLYEDGTDTAANGSNLQLGPGDWITVGTNLMAAPVTDRGCIVGLRQVFTSSFAANWSEAGANLFRVP